MPASIAATILAGGRSRRMGGRDKALQPLAGRPLVEHVILRVAPQVAEVALSVEQRTAVYEAFGLPQLPDPVGGHRGPLGGLLAGLRHFQPRYEWMLLAPCDAPFLPVDLADNLRRAAGAAAAACAAVRYGGVLQPTFSLWHRRLLPDLERAVIDEGQAGFKQFMRMLDLVELDWAVAPAAAGPPPFFNINDPAALLEAAGWLTGGPEGGAECST